MPTPREQIALWRQSLRPQSRYGTPFARNQLPGPENLWQMLTPWREELGETFGQVWEKPLKAFGAAVTSPFTPSVPGTEGLPWLQREQREYEQWQEPTFTTPWGAKIRPTKGIVESLPFFAGGAVLGVAGKLGAAAARGGLLGRAAGVAQKAISPLSAVARGERAVAGAAMRGIGAVVKPIVKPIRKLLPSRIEVISGKLSIPSSEALERRFLPDIRRGIAQWAAKRPLLSGLFKAIGGRAALVKGASKEPQDIVLKEIAKRDVLLAMRNEAVGFYMPKLQRYGSPQKLLRLDEKGIVGAVRGKHYLYDVLENPVKYQWKDATARKYVDDLRGIVDDMYKLARKEGVKTPKNIIIHRMVRGKRAVKGYDAAEFGSNFERERVFKTMREGVEKGIDYGLNPNESVSATISHYIKKIADMRLAKAVKPLRIKGVKKPRLGEAEAITAVHPAFKGVFPKEVVKVAEAALKDEGNRWLRGASGISGAGRLLVAALDFSAPFIQGLPILGRRPDVWIKATLRHYSYFLKPKNLYEYMSRPDIAKIRAERILHGGSSSPFEFYQALPGVQKAVGKIPKVGRPIRRVIEETYGRAEAAFTGFGETARNQLWVALKRKNMSGKQLDELATVIDRMTGVMSSEALGVGLTQRQFESAFLFFAPRYTRAGMKLFTDIFAGGLTGAEARKALGGMMAGGAAMYYGVATAMGQEPDFDPSSAKFMTVEVGGDRIGVGGIFTALARFGADVIATTIDNPSDLFMPFKNKQLNRWDNPFVRFMFTRTSPLTGLLMGAVVEKADYFGRPFEDFGDWGRYLAEKVTPIAAQRLYAEEAISPLGLAGEVTGLRTFPQKRVETPEQKRRVAYQNIEDQIWARYRGNLRQISDDIKKMEREDPRKAKQMLRQYPSIMMARKLIALAKKRWKTRQPRITV